MHPKQMRDTVIAVLPSNVYCIKTQFNLCAPPLLYNGPVKHRTDRILTPSAGRLDVPRDLREMTFSFMAGRGPDLPTVMARVQSGITETIRKQADAGIDVISDGELGKIGFGD